MSDEDFVVVKREDLGLAREGRLEVRGTPPSEEESLSEDMSTSESSSWRRGGGRGAWIVIGILMSLLWEK